MAGQRTRTAGVLLAWLLAAGVATLVGALAVGAIGSGIVPSGQQPLSQAEVDRRLAEPAPSPAPSPSSSSPPSSERPSRTSPPSTPRPRARTFSSRGGTVVAKCAPELVIVQAVPAQGFDVDVDEEDGGQRVRFETEDDARIEVQLACRGGEPVADTRSDNSGRGGGDDDD